MTDTLEKMVSAAKPGEVVPIMSGMTKMAGAFYYRIMLNVFSKGGYDDNFLDHKLPRFLPVISSIKSKLYPIARQVKKHYFLNTDMSDEDEFKPRFAHFLTVSQFSSQVPRHKRLHMLSWFTIFILFLPFQDLLFTQCVSKFNSLLVSKNVPTYGYSFDYRQSICT